MGVEIAGDGEMAIRALENLDRRTELPTSGNAMERLFLTHPLLQQRIKAIRRLEERSTQCTATRAEPQRR